MKNDWRKIITVLKNDGVAVIPTDTLYGVVGKALSKKTVERIYKLKGRDKSKPLIVLISSFDDLKKFNITLEHRQSEFLKTIWPGKVSVIMSVPSARWEYLHRGTKTIAFRMVGPRNRNIYHLIRTVGPLVAPSANPQGEDPARTMQEAKRYFRDMVDLYACGGTRMAKPSTLVEYKNNTFTILRQGAVKIKEKK
ncbi:MAG: L-threonylcarbamoyladenylate synthase [Patescibacteria group bacterium]